MNKLAKNITVTVDEFRRRAEHTELGRLHLPNGYRCGHPEFANVSFFVSLKDLYQLISQGEVGQVPINFDDIIGIIAFGSAVSYPQHWEEVTIRKKFFLFGPYVWREKNHRLVPKDADFLVITRTDGSRESSIEPSWVVGYDICFLRKGGLHIQVGGRESFLEGVKQGDTVCISALEDGIPLFTTPEFEALVAESGIQKQIPRKTYWALEDGELAGWIE